MVTKSKNNYTSLKIIIADDNNTYRQLIKQLIFSEFGCENIMEIGNETDFLDLSEILYTTDLLLVDLQMLNLSGIKYVKRLTFEFPQLKMIAITKYYDSISLRHLIRLGFNGCVCKDSLIDNLIQVVKGVIPGGYLFDEKVPL